MKKFIYTLVILAIVSSVSGQWSEQVSGVTTVLYSVSAVDNDVVWICGAGGKVLRTINGGTNWNLTASPNAALDLYNIWGVDASSAYVTGSSSTAYVYRTTNGGVSWTQVFSQVGGFINAIYGVSLNEPQQMIMYGDPVGGRWSIWINQPGDVWDSTGLYVPQAGTETGYNNAMFAIRGPQANTKIWFGTNNTRIYKWTLSTGWTSQPTPGQANSLAIVFPTEMIGYAGATTSLLSTANGGAIWSNLPGIPGSGIITGLAYGDIIGELFFCRGSSIYHSTSGGINWYIRTTQTGTYNHLIKARTGFNLWAIRDNGGISRLVYLSIPPSPPALISPANYSTETLLNLNLVWSKSQSANVYNVVLATDSAFTNIVLNDSLLTDTLKVLTNLYPVTNYYWKVRERDLSIWGPFSPYYKFKTCSPWYPMNSGVTNNNVNAFAANGSNIFAGTMGGVFLSTNNGLNWTAVNNGLTNLNVKALITNGSNIFAGTENGGIFLSANNGGFWIAVNSGLYSQSITSLITSGNNIFAGTSSGVYRSTNNGGNWISAGLSYTGVNSLFLNGSTIYAGTSGGLFYTYNNGANWNGTFGTMNVNSIAISGTNLYIGTPTGVFLSTNNGASWISNLLSNQNVFALTIYGTLIFAGTESGGIFLSANNGNNWVERNQGFNTTPSTRTFLITNNNIFAGTYGQKVWRRDLSYIIGIKTISEVVPSMYLLQQNYPNPFNPTTKIKFDVARLGDVKIIVYDVTGREVQTLVNQSLKPGTYETSFDGSNLSSGMYFYRLQTEGYSETRKMTLIK